MMMPPDDASVPLCKYARHEMCPSALAAHPNRAKFTLYRVSNWIIKNFHWCRCLLSIYFILSRVVLTCSKNYNRHHSHYNVVTDSNLLPFAVYVFSPSVVACIYILSLFHYYFFFAQFSDRPESPSLTQSDIVHVLLLTSFTIGTANIARRVKGADPIETRDQKTIEN